MPNTVQILFPFIGGETSTRERPQVTTTKNRTIFLHFLLIFLQRCYGASFFCYTTIFVQHTSYDGADDFVLDLLVVPTRVAFNKLNFSCSSQTVLLHNDRLCNGCMTKWIKYLKAFPSKENKSYSENDKKIQDIFLLSAFIIELSWNKIIICKRLLIFSQTPFGDAAVAESTIMWQLQTWQVLL